MIIIVVIIIIMIFKWNHCATNKQILFSVCLEVFPLEQKKIEINASQIQRDVFLFICDLILFISNVFDTWPTAECGVRQRALCNWLSNHSFTTMKRASILLCSWVRWFLVLLWVPQIVPSPPWSGLQSCLDVTFAMFSTFCQLQNMASGNWHEMFEMALLLFLNKKTPKQEIVTSHHFY